VFGLYVASSALGYAATYPTSAARARVAATFGTNVGFNALIGPAHQIGTVAGFTAWRALGVLSIVGAVWGLLAGTRLLRGEEDAGRWELLLVGHTTRRGGAAQALAGLAAGLVTLWVVTAVVTIGVGRDSRVKIGVGASLSFAVALVSSAAIFLTAGVLTSQLAPTRRQAAAYAATGLGVSYVLRMIADSGTGLDWLRWLSPLGWVEELHPLTAPRAVMLLPILALIAVMAGFAIHLAGIRRSRGECDPRSRRRPPAYPAAVRRQRAGDSAHPGRDHRLGCLRRAAGSGHGTNRQVRRERPVGERG
jgi:ABC-2 type transport system permease protein